MSSPPSSAPWWSLATIMLQISSSYLFLSLPNPSLSFPCNTFHLCCLWYVVEDGSDVSVPRTITCLLLYSFSNFSSCAFVLYQYFPGRNLCKLYNPVHVCTCLESSSSFSSPVVCGNFFYGLQVWSFRLQNRKCCCHLPANAKKFYFVSTEWACCHSTSKVEVKLAMLVFITNKQKTFVFLSCSFLSP